MKKILFLVTILTSIFTGLVSANQLGFGYDNGGPTLRFMWDDSITSELSVLADYGNSAYTSDTNTPNVNNAFTFAISPINMALYKGRWGTVNIGIKIRDTVRYQSFLDRKVFTANSYGLDLMLPELELAVPGVDSLRLIGSVGISSSWDYDNSGKLSSFNMGLYGISLANVGIVYYFNLGGGNQAAPAQMPPVKDNTVK